ncbi:MAG: hypothetical protein B7C24_11310 [Bacteroidetes bacterium 4572_77]|nr:MAG: hypothetical protein B7C24_11310 [Bacteroidetes bacterium 4572_77]
MKLLKKILLATDLGKTSQAVVESALNMAKIFKSKIILVHVLPNDIKNEKAKMLLDDAAMHRMNEINDQIKSEGVETSDPILEYGNCFSSVLKTADNINANIVVLGSGEKLENDAFKLGTSTENIIRKSSKPVWVVKNDKPVNVNTILCPVDFSSASKRAMKNAIIIARRFNAKLLVLNVLKSSYTGSLKVDINWDEESDKDFVLRNKHFDKFLEGFNLIDMDWEKEILKGDESKEILRAIKEHQADLLIMGITGRSDFYKMVMGSVTEKVIREVPTSFITLKSEDIIELQLETEIRDIESHHKVGVQLVNDGFYEKAMEEFEICLRINDMHLPSLYAIADVYEKLGDERNFLKYIGMAKTVVSRIWDKKVEMEVRKYHKFKY